MLLRKKHSTLLLFSTAKRRSVSFVIALVSISLIAGCSSFTTSKIEPNCQDYMVSSFAASPNIALSIQSDNTRERLVILSAENSGGISVTGLNSLGAKRFQFNFDDRGATSEMAPLANERRYKRLVESVALIYLFQHRHHLRNKVSSSICQLSLSPAQTLLQNGLSSGIGDVQINSQGATFNIQDLGYNVAFSYLRSNNTN